MTTEKLYTLRKKIFYKIDGLPLVITIAFLYFFMGEFHRSDRTMNGAWYRIDMKGFMNRIDEWICFTWFR